MTDTRLRSRTSRSPRYVKWVVSILVITLDFSSSLDANAMAMLVTNTTMECILTGETAASAFFWRDLRSGATTDRQIKFNDASKSAYLHESQVGTLEANVPASIHNWTIKQWSKHVSSIGVPLLPLLDRRWEGLLLMRTEKNSFSDGIVLPSNEPHINVGVSILTSTDSKQLTATDLLLCEVNERLNNRCYRVIVNGANNTSKLMKCDKHWNMSVSEESCNEVRTFNQGRIGGDGWLNLMIQWKMATKSLDVLYNEGSDDKTYKTLFSYSDTNNNFDVKYFFLGANEIRTFWKLHEYKVLSLMFPQVGNMIQSVSFVVPPSNLNICLEFFYRTSQPGATFNVSVRNLPSFTPITTSKNNNGWVKLRRTIKLPADGNARVQIVGIASKEINNSILIDSIRQCKENAEVRVLKMHTDERDGVACQNVLNLKIIVKYNDKKSHIARGQLQAMIDLCMQVHNTSNCVNTLMCNKNGCACPIGYTGTFCENKCPHSYYGFGCTDTCGECLAGDCHHVTGLCCSGCKPNYKFPFCKEKGSSMMSDGETSSATNSYADTTSGLPSYVHPTSSSMEEGYPWPAICISSAVTAGAILIVLGACYLALKLTRSTDKKVITNHSSVLCPEPVSQSSPIVVPTPAPVMKPIHVPSTKSVPASESSLVDYSPPSFRSNTIQKPMPTIKSPIVKKTITPLKSKQVEKSTPSYKPTREENSMPFVKFTPGEKSNSVSIMRLPQANDHHQRPMLPLPGHQGSGRDSVEYTNVLSSRDDSIYVDEYIPDARRMSTQEESEEEDLYQNLDFHSNSNARVQKLAHGKQFGKH